MMSAAANVDSDLELIAHCLAGDKQAWKQFFQKHDPAIKRGVRTALGLGHHDQNLVDDHVQAVRLLLVEKPKALLAYDPAKGALDAYLAGMAERQVRSYYSHLLRRKTKVLFMPANRLPDRITLEGPENLLLEEFRADELTNTENEFFPVLLGETPIRSFSDAQRRQLLHSIKEKWRDFLSSD